jgi:hypothetical protein
MLPAEQVLCAFCEQPFTRTPWKYKYCSLKCGDKDRAEDDKFLWKHRELNRPEQEKRIAQLMGRRGAGRLTPQPPMYFEERPLIRSSLGGLQKWAIYAHDYEV